MPLLASGDGAECLVCSKQEPRDTRQSFRSLVVACAVVVRQRCENIVECPIMLVWRTGERWRGWEKLGVGERRRGKLLPSLLRRK